MNNDENILKELKELAKEANKRINALEKFTGYRSSFAVKELFDYIDNSKVQGVGTKVKKVRSDEYLSKTQQIAIIKALKNFLSNEASTVKGAKKIQKEYSQKSGRSITPRGASILYNAFKGFRYYQDKYNLSSDFWQDIAPYAKEGTKENWLETFYDYILVEVDTEVKRDAEILYRKLSR